MSLLKKRPPATPSRSAQRLHSTSEIDDQSERDYEGDHSERHSDYDIRSEDGQSEISDVSGFSAPVGRPDLSSARKRLDAGLPQPFAAKDLNVDGVRKEGYLWKQATRLTMKKWRWRWCVLKTDRFLVYKQSGDAEPEDMVHLKGCFLQSPIETTHDSKQFDSLLFKLEDRAGNVRLFAAPSDADLQDWVRKFQLLLTQMNIKTPSFGAPLHQLLRDPQCNQKIPRPVEKLLRYLARSATNSMDIWKPTHADINTIAPVWERNDFNLSPAFVDDAALQVALLRKFLAELPDPVLTFDLYGKFRRVNRVREHSKRIPELKALIASLPSANQMLLFALVEFLHLTSTWTRGQLSEDALRYFGPVLLREQGTEPLTIVEMAQGKPLPAQDLEACQVVATIVRGFEEIWEVEDDEDYEEQHM
jgi:hypothetical protein